MASEATLDWAIRRIEALELTDVSEALGGAFSDLPDDERVGRVAEVAAAQAFHMAGKHNQQSHAHGQAPLEQVPPKKMKKRQKEYEHQVGGAGTEADARAAVPDTDDATQNIIETRYAGSVAYHDVNTGLRDAHGNVDEVVIPPGMGLDGNPTPFADNDELRAAIRQMDHGMDASHTTRDIAVTRVVSNPGQALGSHYSPDGDNSGLTWREHGFVSTHTGSDWHTQDQIERLHGGADNMYDNRRIPTVTMRILVPRGSHALKGKKPKSWKDGEAEVILDRGSTFRVVADHGWDPSIGTHRLDVEVLSA